MLAGNCEFKLIKLHIHPDASEADSVAGRAAACIDRTASKTGYTFAFSNSFIVWSLARGYSTDFTHYPLALYLVAYSRVQPHKALITADHVPFYAPKWREAQFVLVPFLSVPPQNRVSSKKNLELHIKYCNVVLKN